MTVYSVGLVLSTGRNESFLTRFAGHFIPSVSFCITLWLQYRPLVIFALLFRVLAPTNNSPIHIIFILILLNFFFFIIILHTLLIVLLLIHLIHHPLCEGYSGLVQRRYCKRTLLRVQRLIESRGL
jgi:hypothetical protein